MRFAALLVLLVMMMVVVVAMGGVVAGISVMLRRRWLGMVEVMRRDGTNGMHPDFRGPRR